MPRHSHTRAATVAGTGRAGGRGRAQAGGGAQRAGMRGRARARALAGGGAHSHARETAVARARAAAVVAVLARAPVFVWQNGVPQSMQRAVWRLSSSRSNAGEVRLISPQPASRSAGGRYGSALRS